MINTSYKFFVDNSDIKIQKRVLFVTAGTAFQYQRVIIYILDLDSMFVKLNLITLHQFKM